MSPTELFRVLGAPLANPRWSWGASRPDGTVFLRVWWDKIRSEDDRQFVQITHNDKHAAEVARLGHNERNRHVESVRAGAPCYLVMCEAKDVNVIPRKIKSVDSEYVYTAGEMRKNDSDWWIEITGRKAVKDLTPRESS